MEVQINPCSFLNPRHPYRHIDCKMNFRTELTILGHCVIKGARIAKRTRYPILAGFLGRVWIAATTRMQTFILQKGRTEARKSGQKSLQKHFAMYVLFTFYEKIIFVFLKFKSIKTVPLFCEGFVYILVNCDQ